MRSRTSLTVLAVFVLALALAPVDAAVSQRGNARGKAQSGPAFCRSGAGHPVYGRQWCLDKGFGLGTAAWRHAQPGRIKFERAPQGRIEPVRLGAREIAEILTDIALDEIFGESSYDLDRDRLAGEWRGGTDEGLLVLEVLIGDDPVAELTDTDLDGQVDIVLIAEH
jgi:hypothetical protein